MVRIKYNNFSKELNAKSIKNKIRTKIERKNYIKIIKITHTYSEFNSQIIAKEVYEKFKAR